MQIHVDSHRCTGHAMCNASGPDVYELDEMGFCELTDATVRPDLEAQAREGAAACPERAITVTE